MWAFADTLHGRGGDSAHFSAKFISLFLTTQDKAELAKFLGISFRVFITAFDKLGAKKQETFS
ncbi:hypothetical protein D7V94_16820 [Parablautia intestinalis]|uniref:Uncharacterized protein n=1 Tax=Parablautia intestinalis TaxID=2320100 RepID=A0A3A9ADC1_9FIRM|nr:hypothetical protein D7V94_16820 [Parablautia intestinalis]